jgi:hypothetical protein
MVYGGHHGEHPLLWGRVIILGLERLGRILDLERRGGILGLERRAKFHRGPPLRVALMIQDECDPGSLVLVYLPLLTLEHDECDPRSLVLVFLPLLALEYRAVRREQSSPWEFVTVLELEHRAGRREQSLWELVTVLELGHHAGHREQSLWEPLTVLELGHHAGRREQSLWELLTYLELEQHAVLRRNRRVAPLRSGSLIQAAGCAHMCPVQELRQLEGRVADQFYVTLPRGGWGRWDDSDSHRVVGSQAKAT